MGNLENKTREQFIKELENSKKRIAELEKSEVEHKQIRETMHDRDRIYRTLINNLPGFTYRCLNDENWTMSYISEGCKELTGYPQEDFINNKNIAFNDIIDTGYQQKLWNMWQNVLKEKTTFEYEYPIMMKSGQIRWVLERGCGIYSDDGKLQFLEGFITDITNRKRAEEVLRIERDNLKNIFSAIEDGIYIVNQQYDIQYVNPVLVKDFGVYEGRKCYEYFHDRTKVCPWCKSPDVFAGKTVRWEWFSSKNGKTYDLIDTPLKNPDGSISKLEIFRDITDRKKAEEEIAKLSIAVQQSPSVIAITDIKGNLEYVNPKFCEITGYSSKEVIGQNPRILKSGEIPDKIYKEFWDTISSGKEWRGEFHNKKKNGDFFWETANISPIFDKQGKIINYLKVAEDITERKRVEEDLKKNEQFLNSILESVQDGISVLNPDLTVLHVNGIMNKWYKENLPLEGKKCYEVYQNADKPCSSCPSLRCLESGKTEWNVVKGLPGSSAQWIELFSYPIKDPNSDKMTGVVEFVRDITERKRAELEFAKHHEQVEELVIERTGEVERSQKSLVLLMEDVNEVNLELKSVNTILDATNKELEAFSYSVSHDLRAPLTRMDGFSKALIDSCSSNLDDKAVHFLNRIRASSQHMARLIDDLLSLSRITREKVSRQKVYLSRIADAIVKELKASEPGREVNFEIAKELSVNAHRKFVVIILENLLGNAFKFTGKKKNAIIKFGKKIIDGNEVFFIKDNGVGFNMKYYDKIFTAFQRLHSDEEFKGSGIGLAIVQRIINKHGGKIWAESEEGKGATFYFRFE